MDPPPPRSRHRPCFIALAVNLIGPYHVRSRVGPGRGRPADEDLATKPSFLLDVKGGGRHQPAEVDSPQRRQRRLVSKGLGAGPQIRSLWALSVRFPSFPSPWGPGPLPRPFGADRGGCWPPPGRTTLRSMQGAVSGHWFPNPVKFGTISIWRPGALAAHVPRGHADERAAHTGGRGVSGPDDDVPGRAATGGCRPERARGLSRAGADARPVCMLDWGPFTRS